MSRFVGWFCGVVVLATVASPAVGQSIFHDPWLNWDFQNFTGQLANDFQIIVESGTFNPDPTKGEVLIGAPFPTFAVTHGDFDGDGDQDTKLKWSGADVPAGQIAHVGGDMRGSGQIISAQWTKDCNPIGLPLAISYELTEIRRTNSAEIHMQLKMPQSFFDSHPSEQAGWTSIRTFRNIPADLLGLEDINRSLDLSTLTVWEVAPKDKNGVPITGPVMMSTDSFFDVFLDVVGDEFISPNYESLLVAEVLNQGNPIGMFWNLNPQSPEPATVMLLALGGLMALRRRQR
jgi:hypothetical protein